MFSSLYRRGEHCSHRVDCGARHARLIGRWGVALNLAQAYMSRDCSDHIRGVSRLSEAPARSLTQSVRRQTRGSPASLHMSRNQYVNPGGVNGLPSRVTRKVRCSPSVASNTAASAGCKGMASAPGFLLAYLDDAIPYMLRPGDARHPTAAALCKTAAPLRGGLGYPQGAAPRIPQYLLPSGCETPVRPCGAVCRITLSPALHDAVGTRQGYALVPVLNPEGLADVSPHSPRLECQ